MADEDSNVLAFPTHAVRVAGNSSGEARVRMDVVSEAVLYTAFVKRDMAKALQLHTAIRQAITDDELWVTLPDADADYVVGIDYVELDAHMRADATPE